jgi:drug/metabolite transporter (DMT)-like permease
MKTNWKKILGMVVAVVGVIMVVFAEYIASQVAEGREQIEQGQGKVNTINKIFSVNPTSEQVGKQLTKPAQNKIDQGKRDVAHYASLAERLRVAGIVLMVGGGALFFWGRKNP